MPHAMQIRRTGGPEVLNWTPIEVGEPGSGQVRLRQAAAGLNYIDVYHRTGYYSQPLPFIPRLAIILEYGASRPFEPFDREAQLRERDGKSLPALLQEFADSRLDSIARLRAMHLTPEKLELNGMHPGLGIVTARQLMATWTAHDLGHLLQISRVMAKRYKQEVGPWAAYLSVMK